ncbi:helix-turn-helix transcriptional regulator [Mesorhizobium sp.]|uniref:helix-turn-helix transcriptional regulator n=1 Tax=Mesorhizobium sp. TaxID=1871066 RepID=UPI003BA8E972
MRRADRLFQIIQIMRRSSRPVTAGQLAEELEVSKRSVYRDIADLMAQRVPIEGAAGLGYVLDREFDMPPLMLTPDELEAAVLGAQWVADRGDAVLAAAARDLIAKISASVPEHLRPFIANPTIGPTLGAPPGRETVPDGIDVTRTRQWIRAGRKMRIRYRDDQGRESERTIWPTIIGYAETVRLLAAWCELRANFRHFRMDRIIAAEFLEERHGRRPADLRAQWTRHFEAERGAGLF